MDFLSHSWSQFIPPEGTTTNLPFSLPEFLFVVFCPHLNFVRVNGSVRKKLAEGSTGSRLGSYRATSELVVGVVYLDSSKTYGASGKTERQRRGQY